MLVLTRKAQQQIRIGDDITITILRIKGQSIRVGVEAPREVHVVRGELPPLDTPAEADAPAQTTATISDAIVEAIVTASPAASLTQRADKAKNDTAHRARNAEKRPKSELPVDRALRQRTVGRTGLHGHVAAAASVGRRESHAARIANVAPLRSMLGPR